MSLGDLRKSIGDALYRQVGRASGHVQSHRSLPVDVLENETAYQVVFDAPGVEPDDVQVRYLEGTVKIRLERFREYRDRYEIRFPGRGMELDGEADLPEDAIVDPDAGTATLTESGTLRIDIPKDPSLETAADATEESVTEESDSSSESNSTGETESDSADESDESREADEITADD
ncbi:Hsp20/alpha crystallin family protein [Natronolimnohabitans innermongolicus]|uniref:Molecular chaperone (Small heat shock protein)-like protein n=1 Tax=Natronolimnohabitans innermongolicus JCM 12255 TaxID=1227499 RepID=L9XJH2_9EURY|nr:Hsp20 family protein [Natronolimnohabitans innermongolicus]ELY60803.1 Molecular chaperone (small heat shock protein)- like protein [Natronolimnohabitans innermongolicus JCM 12255]